MEEKDVKKYREALESAYEKSLKLFEEFEKRIEGKKSVDIFDELAKFTEEKRLTPAEVTWLSVMLFEKKKKEVI